VVIVFSVGLAMALLTGAAIGLSLMAAYYQRVASQRRKYEQEIAESRDLYAAALAVLRHSRPVKP
jgi:formate hydrogenlyase subunit 3/multisubunit Na+/H+ antiporter MnhD subunit